MRRRSGSESVFCPGVSQSALEPLERYRPSGTAQIGVDAAYTAKVSHSVGDGIQHLGGPSGKC